jgi:hypothetical protein
MNKDDERSEIFNNERIRIYTNPAGEVFIESIQSGLTMRLDPFSQGELNITSDGRVEAVVVSGRVGYRIIPR